MSEAAAHDSASHRALGGTAAPPECGAPPPTANRVRPEEAGVARGFREGASQQCGARLLTECLVLSLPSLGVTADLVRTWAMGDRTWAIGHTTAYYLCGALHGALRGALRLRTDSAVDGGRDREDPGHVARLSPEPVPLM